jgi:hypothetical protein
VQALTQITFPYDFGDDDYGDDKYEAPGPLPDYILLQELFWIFSSTCLACSMHVVLTTIFIQLMGPRMALYGSVGSMAKAAGEQTAVVISVAVVAGQLTKLLMIHAALCRRDARTGGRDLRRICADGHFLRPQHANVLLGVDGS